MSDESIMVPQWTHMKEDQRHQGNFLKMFYIGESGKCRLRDKPDKLLGQFKEEWRSVSGVPSSGGAELSINDVRAMLMGQAMAAWGARIDESVREEHEALDGEALMSRQLFEEQEVIIASAAIHDACYSAKCFEPPPEPKEEPVVIPPHPDSREPLLRLRSRARRDAFREKEP